MIPQSNGKKKREKAKKRREYIIVGSIALVVILIVGIYTRNLQKTVDANMARADRLQAQIEEQIVRQEELEKQSIFMQSTEFIEKMARERLKLVNPNDKIIKPLD